MIDSWKPIDELISNMVWIPSGICKIGSTLTDVDHCVSFWGKRLCEPSFTEEGFRHWIMKEYPQHKIKISSFWLGRYPITNHQYQCFVEAIGHPSSESMMCSEPANHPVWGIDLNDIQTFLYWLNDFSNKRFRLPTEFEWEYSAKGPSEWEYPFGPKFNAMFCNTLESNIGRTTPVEQYADHPSEFGICDLAGNVEEWTSSRYAPYPNGKFIKDDLVLLVGERYPILRGGSFKRGGDLTRSARRHGPHPGSDYKYIGYRLATDDDP